MNSFYIIILALSGVYLAVQLAAYIFFDKIFFPDAGILFEQRKNRFEWQMIFPKNLLLLIIFLFFTSGFGLIMDSLGVVGWLSLPLAAIGGLAVNFIINYAIVPALAKTQDSGQPTDEELDGAEAVAVDDIFPDSYGRIKVKHGSRSYYFDALTANGRELHSGERLLVIHAEEGLCFVESEEHICDILFEEEQTAEAPEAVPEQRNRDTADFGADVTEE